MKNCYLRRIFFAVFSILLSHIFFGSSLYGVVQKLGIEELTTRSTAVIKGTVTNMHSRWEQAESGKRIFTFVEIDVQVYIKGVGNSLIEVKVPGGKVGDITEKVSDTPVFSVGEEVILFLKPDFFQIVGWHQGKFQIKNDKISRLNVPVDDFMQMIQKIQLESLTGPRDVLPTSVARSQIDLETKKSSFQGEPVKIVLDKTLSPSKSKEDIAKPVTELVVSNEGQETVAAWNDIMTEGFEGAFPAAGWTVLGDPTWDDDDFLSNSGYWSAWCANGGASGVDPQFNDYPNNMDAWMIYGPFDLSDAVDAELLFYYWNRSELNYDRLYWMASTNGSTFYGYNVSGDSGGWRYINFDLTAVPTLGDITGASSVWIAFVFKSDSSVTDQGAFIDDIVLRKTGLPNLTPYQPAGWADKIVISNHAGDNNNDFPLYCTDTLFIDWAVINNGTENVDVRFYTRLYLDGVEVDTWFTDPPFSPAWYAYVEDYPIGPLSGGTHTITLVADYDNRIEETDEADNIYERVINIVCDPPNITDISPAAASAGTDTSVTLTGVNFGATQGTGVVEFFYRSGQAKIEALIVSWSDTAITCKVPQGASSGPVTVTTDSGTSTGYDFTITFGYGNLSWPGDHPYVPYVVNENTADCVGERDAVIRAANQWSYHCGKFTFIYDGPTTATASSLNGINEILWGSTSGTIATTYTWFSGDTIVECDIVFDDSFDWSTNAAAGTFDVQNVAIHQMGHFLFLTDLYGDIGGGDDTEKTMYGYIDYGESKKRTLHADDAVGIRWIYGAGGDAWDPGDDTGPGATALTPVNGVWQTHGRHTLTACDYYDWYVIYLEIDNRYTFRSTCDFPVTGLAGDVMAELYSDSSGTTLVAGDDDSGGNAQFEFSYKPTASGFYYLKVNTVTGSSFWSGYIEYLQQDECIPGTFSYISPANGAAGVSTEADLDWADSSNASSYDVYFGTTTPPPFVTNVPVSTYNPGTMNVGTTYYWRIEAWTSCGFRAGPIWSFTTQIAPALPEYLVFHGHDFTGNGSSDVAVWKPSNGRWYIKGGSWPFWGGAGDVCANGDYNGDGTTDVAVWKPSNGRWYIKGQAWPFWGGMGDIPVPGDYNGDTITEVAVWRPSNGRWYIKGMAWPIWGSSGDLPVPGDYDGNGTTDVAVWRSSNSTWYIQGQASKVLGQAGDVPVPADYDGDGVTEAAVWRPADGKWYIEGMSPQTWGTSGDVPVPGDFNGDGITDIAVWRPTNGRWYIKGQVWPFWGGLGDLPLVR